MPVVWNILQQSAAFWTALVGFIGVITTILGNGVLQRRADQRRFDQQLAIDKLKLDHDAAILRTALRAELSQLLTIIYAQAERAVRTTRDTSFGGPFDISQRERLKWLKARMDAIIGHKIPEEVNQQTQSGWRDEGGRIPFLTFFLIYEKSLDKLGILTRSEVDALTFAYYRYQHRIGQIISNSAHKEKSIDPGTGVGIPYEFTRFEQRWYLLIDIRDIAYGADRAIEQIDMHMAPPTSAEVGLADALEARSQELKRPRGTASIRQFHVTQ